MQSQTPLEKGRPIEDYTAEEISTAAMIDGDFYGRFFFPKTSRQSAPAFHHEIDDVLERPENRYIAIEAFRGSAKTSKLRLLTSKRIAYGQAHTILFLSDTEGHAVKSIQWLQSAVTHNRRWADFFKLRPGKKWTENDIEIIHGVEEYPIRVIGAGITGQIRGLNVEDYRPDLIIGDDMENEENTATPEQRNKVSNLFFGAVAKSLAPVSENPKAQLIALGTPLHQEALIEVVRQDPTWTSRRYGCFTPDGQSRWPERFPLEELLREKESYVARNQLSLWLREMECRVISPETAAFRIEWLNYWDVLPDSLVHYIAIDPAPILSDTAKQKRLTTDYQAVVVIGVSGKKVFLVEYSLVRDQNPEELAMEIFRMLDQYKPVAVGVETVAYQKNLEWYLRKAMEERNRFFYLRPIKDRRAKHVRIRQAITNRASNRLIYVHRSHNEFIQQYVDYPDVSYDDLLDGFSIALDMIDPGMAGVGAEDYTDVVSEPLPNSWRSAP